MNNLLQTMFAATDSEVLLDLTLKEMMSVSACRCAMFLGHDEQKMPQRSLMKRLVVCLEHVLGDVGLARHIGRNFLVSSELVTGGSRFLDEPALWHDLHDDLDSYCAALVLPGTGCGFFLLLFPVLPRHDAQLAHCFDPLLKHFGQLLMSYRVQPGAVSPIAYGQKDSVKRLEDQVVRLSDELERAKTELELIHYSISHDLSAPLRSISGFSQVLIEDYSDQLDAQGRDYLSRMNNASHKLGAMMKDLLGLSRITSKKINFTDINLSHVATDVMGQLTIQFSGENITWDIESDIRVKADAELIAVALEHFFSNAIKFRKSKMGACIKFGCHINEGKPVYFISDKGVGFDEHFMHKLFTPFQRLHSATEFAGSGIGLSVVERIIHKHGGRVWAESIPGQKTTFFFTLS